MKKFFTGGYDRSGWIGKQYQIGPHLCTVEDIIAEGGFALVFLAKTANGHRCALKRLSVNEEVDLQVCKREIQILKMISGHKNTMKFYDASINVLEHGIYEVLILTEFCRAGNVIDLMNENISSGFSEQLILKIFCDTCEALSLLHHNQPPVLHRDLKVENVLRKESGDFVLCDFGSATFGIMDPKKDGAPAVEENLQKYTTLAYRSPEMVDLYAGHVIDIKSDIWAMGCLLYKLCFFTTPFGESTLAIQNGQFSFPDRSEFSKELHQLISYILNPDPEKRPDIFQISYLAFKLSGRQCPVPNKNNSPIPDRINTTQTSNASKDRRDGNVEQHRNVTNVNSGPVMTSVAPRERPVTTSLAPRQRPKGNNQNIGVQDDGAAPFKNASSNPLQRGSNLRRSHSLKEVKRQNENESPIAQRRDLSKQATSSVSQQHLHQQARMMPQQTQEQQLIYMQQQQRQKDLFLLQQQKQYEFYAQQHQIYHQHQQQYLQQQEYMQKQKEYLAHQEYLKKQRDNLMRQQEQEMLQRQKQEEEYLRQRQEEYLRLQMQASLQSNAQNENQTPYNQALISEDFNPRQCRSVEPPPSSPRLDNKGQLVYLFEDDFARSSPDLLNPFNETKPNEKNPFQEKRKTHTRSRSDTFTKLMHRNIERNELSIHNLEPSVEETSPVKSPPKDYSKALEIEIDSVAHRNGSGDMNPFAAFRRENKPQLNEPPIQTQNTSHPSNSPSRQNKETLPTAADLNHASNVQTGILLDFDDDDKKFMRLQKEFSDITILQKPTASIDVDGIPIVRNRTHSDASPLISPAASYDNSETRYSYKRSSSCSSSDRNSSDDDSSETESQEVTYKSYKSPEKSKAKTASHSHTSQRDVFDSAPFSVNDTKSTVEIVPQFSSGMKIERRNARKERLDSRGKTYSPFDDNFMTEKKDFRQKLDSDPFKMAPMKIAKGKNIPNSESTRNPATTSQQPPSSNEQRSRPTQQPSRPTQQPSSSSQQHSRPTQQPSRPTQQPSRPTQQPSRPTQQPSRPTQQPPRQTQQPSSSSQQPTRPVHHVKPQDPFQEKISTTSIPSVNEDPFGSAPFLKASTKPSRPKGEHKSKPRKKRLLPEVPPSSTQQNLRTATSSY